MSLRLISFFLFLFSSCFAAGPITHAYLTEQFFETFPKYGEEEKRAFMIGTLFPDIRYLGNVLRDETHVSKISLKEILEEPSPFLAGVYFHSYVDIKRETFLRKNKIERILNFPATCRSSLFLKMVEDQIVYEKKEWGEWVLALKCLYAEEFGWKLHRSELRKWHNLLIGVFLNGPMNAVSFFHFCNHNFIHASKSQVQEWNKKLPKEAAKQESRAYMDKLLSHFNALFQEEASKERSE